MESLYRSPLRVYLTLGLLSLIGLWSAFHLPVSLFPNSAKPKIEVCMPSEMSPEAFSRAHGRGIEEQLRGIVADDLAVDKVTAEYSPRESCFEAEFKWGNSPQKALREVQSVMATASARLPPETRDRVRTMANQENSGFLAVVFFSQKRSLDEIYRILDPLLSSSLAKVNDAADAGLFNPQQRQLIIELRPEAMAAFGLFPSDVAGAVQEGLAGYGAGSIAVGADTLTVQVPRPAQTAEELRRMPVAASRGRSVTLGDVARVDVAVPVDSARVFKTNGAPSLILFASPKPGGNVKAMSEQVLSIIEAAKPSFPEDIQYKVLVDPSEFIRAAVSNVGHEVLIAAMLAVAVLFLFVGNARNVATAAIEIPISIVLAFVLMRLTGVNLNLISLGGLALSAGMNVDASVVVMENIFRVFDEAKARGENPSFERRAQLVVEAVQEVKFAVIASTIASLVVFLPLAFTSELSYALLGDLAKAVVFSHGFSALVALVLVPTIRLQLLGAGGRAHDKPAPLEGGLRWLENAYARSLGAFLRRPKAQWIAGGALVVSLAVIVGAVLPRLPREIVGKPDTDWIMLGINTRGNSLNRQMDAQTETVERDLLRKFGAKIQYTFVQVNRPNSSWIMARLKDKRDMEGMWKDLESAFPNTPFVTYWVDAWNPAELPIPNPPDFEASVRGAGGEALADAARDLADELRERKVFPWVKTQPNASLSDGVFVRPRLEVWPKLAQAGLRFTAGDLADLARTALGPRYVTRFSQGGEDMDAYLRFPEGWVATPEELSALPVGLGGRIVPLKALAVVERRAMPAPILRENGRDAVYVTGRLGKGEEASKAQAIAAAEKAVAVSRARLAARAAADPAEAGKEKSRASFVVENASRELDAALAQLAIAVSLSIVLIFATMVYQFGSVMNALLVLAAIPLGFIGVGLSLFVFRSTLSLNSMLGVILLNGISVANSIILVDFLGRAVREGHEPGAAAIEVGRKRLRPILMTSLTTALGMLPIAFGYGEGGKVLQPLGIAVAGGLAFSMATTLFIVPALQVAWLRASAKRSRARGPRRGELAAEASDVVSSGVAGAPLRALLPLAFAASFFLASVASAQGEASAAEDDAKPAAPPRAHASEAPPTSGAPAITSPTESATAPAPTPTPSPAGPATAQTGGPATATKPAPGEVPKPPPTETAEATKGSAAALDLSPAPGVTGPAPHAGARSGEEPELGFKSAFEKILDRSLRVQSQEAQINVMEARRFRAIGQFAPSVSAQTTTIQEGHGLDPSVWGRRTGYLSAKLNVFRGGADVEATRAAREQVSRERAQLEVEKQGAEFDATSALVDAIGRQLLRDIAAQLAASNAEINQVARQRYEKGLMPAQEAEKARIELDNARARLNDAEAELARVRANLRALLGSSRVRPEWPWKDAIARDGSAGAGLADAPFDMRKRPDWRAASYQAEADRKRAKSFWRRLWPSLDLQANYGSENLEDPGRRDWSTLVTLSTTLFDQGDSIGLAREREAQARQSALQKEAVERRADAEIEINRQAHRIAARSALAREKSLESARSLLDDSEKRFRLGRASVNDLALDQNRFAESERLAIDGWSQAHLSLARLCHVLGGRIEADGDCRRP